jgi:hypothetical protein
MTAPGKQRSFEVTYVLLIPALLWVASFTTWWLALLPAAMIAAPVWLLWNERTLTRRADRKPRQMAGQHGHALPVPVTADLER